MGHSRTRTFDALLSSTVVTQYRVLLLLYCDEAEVVATKACDSRGWLFSSRGCCPRYLLFDMFEQKREGGKSRERSGTNSRLPYYGVRGPRAGSEKRSWLPFTAPTLVRAKDSKPPKALTRGVIYFCFVVGP